VRPGLYEYQIAAKMVEIHAYGGSEGEAYAPIVGTGLHSTVLHFNELDAQIENGDVVLLDVGAQYSGYAADVTRTLPANGHFTARQREIYEIVLGAQNAVLAELKPGMTLGRTGSKSLFQIAYNYMNSHGTDRQGQHLGRYFIHGLGHHIGLDVHDAGDADRPLEAGMVVTVEPGLYLPEEKIGVRIEDDVLITPTGYKLLTERLPRGVNEIEAIMASPTAAPIPASVAPGTPSNPPKPAPPPASIPPASTTPPRPPSVPPQSTVPMGPPPATPGT
jgi:Xaa-Pro aminopeptidase